MNGLLELFDILFNSQKTSRRARDRTKACVGYLSCLFNNMPNLVKNAQNRFRAAKMKLFESLSPTQWAWAF